MSAPLVLLAMDTGDAGLIADWVAEGRLPTIGRLMERGCWGTTGGPETICEYGFGLTLFSGISRRDHGYYYFRQLEPGGYDIARVRPPIDRAPPFWNALRGTERKALVVDVPDLRPIPGVPGLQLSDWATHHGSIYEPESEPPELVEDVRKRYGPRMKIHSDPDSTPAQVLAGLEKLLARTAMKGELARDLLGRESFDLAAIFFSETDAASHYLWDYHTGVKRDEDPQRGPRLRDGLREAYESVDREMGAIVEQLSPDATVFVLSLYGYQDEYPAWGLIQSFLDELGYRVPRGPARVAGESRRLDPVAIARRIVPQRMREAISRRLLAGAQEKLLSSALRDGTDWERTVAFAVPSLYTSFVRVNLEGREPRGAVASGREYNDVLTRIEADLFQLVDPETNAAAVRAVSRAVDLFGGDPPERLPDLFVEWEPQPRLVTAVEHPRARITQSMPPYCPSGQEKLSGFFAAAGPGIGGRGALGEVDLLDLAPTFLALLGLSPTQEMSGRPNDAILSS